jgi:CxxC motif-containing protein
MMTRLIIKNTPSLVIYGYMYMYNEVNQSFLVYFTAVFCMDNNFFYCFDCPVSCEILSSLRIHHRSGEALVFHFIHLEIQRIKHTKSLIMNMLNNLRPLYERFVWETWSTILAYFQTIIKKYRQGLAYRYKHFHFPINQSFLVYFTAVFCMDNNFFYCFDCPVSCEILSSLIHVHV